MRASRTLLGAALAGFLGGPALAQPDAPAPNSVGAVDPLLARPVPTALPEAPPPAPAPAPMQTLTGGPLPTSGPTLPPGSYPGLWSGSSPAGCCGPVGGNGPTPYELFLETGPVIPLGGSDLSDALNGGWYVGGGGRTLFMNPSRDAAWVLGAGLSYAYNDGKRVGEIITTFAPRSRAAQNAELLPDGTASNFLVRGLHRTNFNVTLGRDWFSQSTAGAYGEGRGPGHYRHGPEVGGRWGSSRIDMIPVLNTATYFRRSGVSHGVFVGYHWDYEVPVSTYTFFIGFKANWNYDWMNLIPPSQGDLMSVNLLGTVGFRF